jgi:type VI secretion system protein ImpB
VQITYDVQIGDAQEEKELPFVFGIMADLSGHRDPDAPPRPPLKNDERRFVEINRHTFEKVMGNIQPRLALRVDNELQKDGSKMGVELKFRTIEDFEPANVVRNATSGVDEQGKPIKPLLKLLEARQRLAELKTKIVSNDKLEGLLQRIIHDTDQLRRLARETGRLTDDSPQAGAETETAPDAEEESR